MMESTYDIYGFKRSKHSIQNQSDLFDTQQEKANYHKWKCLQPILHTMKIQKQRQLIQLVRNGIPDILRFTIWPKLLTKPIKPFEYYFQQYKKGNELKQINLDLDRTMPNNNKFSEKREKLKNILNTVAVAMPQMGYCQGLNFIAANLLLILQEKQAFQAMYHILYWQRHELLMTNLQKIHCKIYCLSKLLKRNYPKLYKTIQKCESQPLVFTSSWFITLFNNILPYYYVFRIMECYFLQGDKILYRVALQIFKQKKKMIKTMESEEQIIGELTKFDDFNISMMDRFFAEMFQIQLSRKDIETWQAQYQQKKL